MYNTLWLPDKELRTKKIEVPGLKQKIALNFVIIKGIHLHWNSVVEIYGDRGCNEDLLGKAEVYEVKYMTLADLLVRRYVTDGSVSFTSGYPKLCKSFYHSEKAGKSLKALREVLTKQYDGIIDGEIVTLVFFIPDEELIASCGTTAETTNCKSPE